MTFRTYKVSLDYAFGVCESKHSTPKKQVQWFHINFPDSPRLLSNGSSQPIPTCMFLETLLVSKREALIYTQPFPQSPRTCQPP